MVDVAHLVRNNIYVFGIRGEGRSATHRAQALMAARRFDATKIHTHTFGMEDLPTALRYARDRVDGAIKVVVKMGGSNQSTQTSIGRTSTRRVESPSPWRRSLRPVSTRTTRS